MMKTILIKLFHPVIKIRTPDQTNINPSLYGSVLNRLFSLFFEHHCFVSLNFPLFRRIHLGIPNFIFIIPFLYITLYFIEDDLKRVICIEDTIHSVFLTLLWYYK